MGGLGDDEADVGVVEVAEEVLALAGVVQADDGRPDQCGAREGEDVLGDVVGQDADMGRRAGGQPLVEEDGVAAGLGVHLGVRPHPVAVAEGGSGATSGSVPLRRMSAAADGATSGACPGAGAEVPVTAADRTCSDRCPRRDRLPSSCAAGRGPGRPAEGRELRARGVETMHRLLAAGVVVFGKRGLHAARVDDIVQTAKTSHGTFYRYFASKEDLFRALTTDVAERLGELADSLGEIGPGPEGTAELRAWVARFRDVYDEYGPVIQTWTEAEQDDTPEGDLGADV